MLALSHILKTGCVNLAFLCILGFTGCIDLAHVNRYAGAGEKEMTAVSGMTYNFKQACLERCGLEAIRKFEIRREETCDCKTYEAADQAVKKIENILGNYFRSLAALSENELTKYNTDPLKDALVEGKYGSLTIEKKQVEAYSSIGNILLRAGTDAYRKKRIKEYISEANTPIQELFAKLVFILRSNLATELDFKKESLYAYFAELKQSRNLSDYEKGKAVADYYEQLNGTRLRKDQILSYAKGLEKTADGHQQLFENRNQLSDNTFRTLLKEYAKDIEEILDNLHQLRDQT